MTDKWLTLIPAYGRDYRTADAVLAAWIAGKDFRIMDVSCRWDGSYTSCRDHEDGLEYTTFKIRYGTILNTGFVLPHFALIKKVAGGPNGTWIVSSKSDGVEEEDEEESIIS